MSLLSRQVGLCRKHEVKGYSPITEQGSVLCPWFSGIVRLQSESECCNHVRDKEVTFSSTGSKWQIDVNALTQTLFQTARVFHFHLS